MEKKQNKLKTGTIFFIFVIISIFIDLSTNHYNQLMKNRALQSRIEKKLAKPKTSNLIPHETHSKNVLPFIVEVFI